MILVEEAGQRLDQLLTKLYPGHSRTYFQGLIEEGCVLVNGAAVKKRTILNMSDEIEVCFRLTPELSAAPEPIPLDLLFEDSHLLAINKPAGMVVHPAPGHPSGTFVNALLAHCQIEGEGLRPGIVHRLDKETSGVLLAAKTIQAHRNLIELFQARRIQKQYLAICAGVPLARLIQAPIGRHPTRRKEMAIVEGGKEAITRIEVLESRDGYSLVLARPETGRTHQIRVHLRHVGAPVAGDEVYGKRGPFTRHMLHAWQLELPHPITQELLHLKAPLPKDFILFPQ